MKAKKYFKVTFAGDSETFKYLAMTPPTIGSLVSGSKLIANQIDPQDLARLILLYQSPTTDLGSDSKLEFPGLDNSLFKT